MSVRTWLAAASAVLSVWGTVQGGEPSGFREGTAEEGSRSRCTVVTADAREPSRSPAAAAPGRGLPRFSVETTVGTGIALTQPGSTPLLWRAAGYCRIGQRLFAGVGTGLSFYEKTLLPLYADLRLNCTRPRRFTPFVSFGAGYSFALSADANGGGLFMPAAGVRYAVGKRWRLLFSVGCEWQRLERLRRYEDRFLRAEFVEELRHATLVFRLGAAF